MKRKLLMLIISLFAIAATFTPAAIAAPEMTVFHADQSKTFAVGKYQFSFRDFSDAQPAENAESAFSVVEITSAPQYAGFLLQRHRIDVPENFYALSGEFEFFGARSDQKLRVNAGDVVQIPAGFPYGYKNTSSKPGKLLLVTTSQGFERFIAEVGKPSDRATSISPQPEAIDKIAGIAPKYGIEFLN